MGLTKDRLIYDGTDLTTSDAVASHIIGPSGDEVTVTNVSSDYGLDVYLLNASITVTATDLDIRDLSYSTDSIQIIDADGDALAIAADGSLTATVTATDLDIRDISHLVDSIQVGDGNDIMLVNGDGSINAVVTATDLDIRDLTAASDSVAISDGSDTLAIESDGSINVNNNGFGSWKVQAVTVTTSAGEVAATPLTGRKKVKIQNFSNKDIYIGPDNTVTVSGATMGNRIARGATEFLDLNATADIYIIGDTGITGSNNIQITEFA